ncbi:MULTISPECIES: NAD(P)-binding protein [Streptomyces]|uniref:Potassium transporter TrkA n=1 Tax=Streptomyces lycii TaxID=2654337 RepID=A0ABQ7F8Z8_9ACTN|nr:MULTISPECIES: NAD(P)-binding protein [Streptomyces]KAF4405060.1 potassium transporter TrkA [Streptomyces lycii]PGH47709.1 potassium transporter TrkA [Streptomyces sp. Ru87]
MVVCGDDALAHRLAAELSGMYREPVTLVLPVTREGRRRPPAGAPGRRDPVAPVRVLEAGAVDDTVLTDAGIETAEALALVYDDDETNIHAALRARRLNPRLRLVIRLYNRKLGQHLEELLDRAVEIHAPDLDRRAVDASTTVLSDADTAAPALTAAAVVGTSKVIRADGLFLRATERPPAADGGPVPDAVCTLALLSATEDPEGGEGSDDSGADGPLLLPDDELTADAAARGRVMLETVTHSGPQALPRFGGGLPLGKLFSRRLTSALLGMVAALTALGVASSLLTGDDPLHAVYLSLLDVIAIADPAVGEDIARQVLQLLSGMVGLLLLPVLVAAVLEGLGTFRAASTLRRPRRGLSGHVVLLGLGKIGTRVLAQLHEMGIPVVCVEQDPEARGVAMARGLRVPTVVGDVTDEGVLEAAKVHRARALLALTSSDSTNLESVLYARGVKEDLRVVLRLYDDRFAAAVYRTLRDSHPQAMTRSRSVSSLAAPAFAGAMMGRQILGAIPVERRVLLFAAVDVADCAALEGRTVGETFRPGSWRVLALDVAEPADRRADLAAPAYDGDSGREGELVWEPPPGYVLRAEDRVVLAATRRGLGELLGRRPHHERAGTGQG